MKIKETVEIGDSIFDLVDSFDRIRLSVSKIWLENIFDEDGNEYIEEINGNITLSNGTEVRLITNDGRAISKNKISLTVIRLERKELVESLKLNLENYSLNGLVDYYTAESINGGFVHLTISDNYASVIECRLILIDKLYDKLLKSIKDNTLSNLSFAPSFVNLYRERKTKDNAEFYDRYKLKNAACVIADKNSLASLFGIIDDVYFVQNSIRLIADELKNDDEDLTDDEKFELLSFFDKSLIQLLHDIKQIAHRGATILIILLIVAIIAALI